MLILELRPESFWDTIYELRFTKYDLRNTIYEIRFTSRNHALRGRSFGIQITIRYL